MRKFLNILNLFSFQIGLNFSGFPVIKNIEGLFPSLFYMTLYLLSVYYLGKQMIERKDPSSTFTRDYTTGSELITFNP